MVNKPLLAGLAGFLAGGFLVSLAATTFDKPIAPDTGVTASMRAMTESLEPLKGDAYDKAFLAHMIDHHQAAVDMAELSAQRSGHKEIKDLSLEIMSAQETEIARMRQWQKLWNLTTQPAQHDEHAE